jgi:hypothetical protein
LVFLAALALPLAVLVAPTASAGTTPPFTIGPADAAVVPGADGAIHLEDPEGNVKELGPLNSNTTKIGVIHADGVPTLGLTNPNGQVDLRQAWLNTAKDADQDDWIYFAWERDNETGSGFIAFEFMKAAAPTACVFGPSQDTDALIANCNPWDNRAAGDFLILWDQQGGSKDLWLRVWSGSGDNLTLSAPSLIPSSYGQAEYSADGFFGEAAVNITDAIYGGVQQCLAFANIIPSTVTGNSDTADYKDTILTSGITLTNCGKVIIRKQTLPDEDPNTTSFSYTKNFSSDPAVTSPFTLKDDGVQEFLNVPFGASYTVTESAPPAGWAFKSLDCSASSTSVPAADRLISGMTVTFKIDQGTDVLDCTYTNEALGAIKIVKTKKHAATGSGDYAHAGVTFTIKKGTTTVATPVTGADGTVCVGNLALGTDYTVTETVPTGYAAEGLVTKNVTVTSGTCAGTPNTVTFKNLPLTDLTVLVSPQIAGGTNSKITCVEGSTTLVPDPADGTPTLFDDTSETVKNLKPGTFVCTVVIDP